MRTRLSTSAVVTVDVSVIVTIHQSLVTEFALTNDPISPAGIRDLTLLESAVHRQHTALGEIFKYATPFESAASLMYGLCNNHPFFNGNKRTALVAGLVHLDRNGLVLDGVNRDDVYRLMLRIASHFYAPEASAEVSPPSPDVEISAIANWLRKNARAIKRGDRSISYGVLYEIISNFGYRLGQKRNNYVEVLRHRPARWLRQDAWECVYKLPCPGDGRLARIEDIKNVRKALGLTEDDGVDSEAFYGTQRVIDSFINSHRQILKKLART